MTINNCFKPSDKDRWMDFLCEQLHRNTHLGEHSQQTVQTTSVACVVFTAHI